MLLVPLLTILCVPTAATYAAPVKFYFSGSIDAIYDPLDQLQGRVALGSLFQGYYTFDPNAVDSNASATLAQYRSTGAEHRFVVAVGGMTFTRTGTDGPAGMEIVVGDNNSGLDVYDIQGAAGSLTNGPNVSTIGDVVSGIILRDGDQTALSSTALPLEPPSLAPFSDASSSPNFNLNQFELTASLTNQSILFRVSGPVEHLTIPEPSTLLTFFSGLVAVAFGDRRRARSRATGPP